MPGAVCSGPEPGSALWLAEPRIRYRVLRDGTPTGTEARSIFAFAVFALLFVLLVPQVPSTTITYFTAGAVLLEPVDAAQGKPQCFSSRACPKALNVQLHIPGASKQSQRHRWAHLGIFTCFASRQIP